jgi:hypothetical protein
MLIDDWSPLRVSQLSSSTLAKSTFVPRVDQPLWLKDDSDAHSHMDDGKSIPDVPKQIDNLQNIVEQTSRKQTSIKESQLAMQTK